MLLIIRLIYVFQWKTDICAAVHATFETEQLIYHIASSCFTCLQDSEWEVIPVSGVYDLVYKVHHFLDKAVSKWVRNTVWFFLITVPGTVVMSGLCSSLSFTPWRTPPSEVFLLLLHQLESGTGLVTNSFLACHSIQPMFPFNIQSNMCHIIVVHIQQGNLPLTLELRVTKMAEIIWLLIWQFSEF